MGPGSQSYSFGPWLTSMQERITPCCPVSLVVRFFCVHSEDAYRPRHLMTWNQLVSDSPTPPPSNVTDATMSAQRDIVPLRLFPRVRSEYVPTRVNRSITECCWECTSRIAGHRQLRPETPRKANFPRAINVSLTAKTRTYKCEDFDNGQTSLRASRIQY